MSPFARSGPVLEHKPPCRGALVFCQHLLMSLASQEFISKHSEIWWEMGIRPLSKLQARECACRKNHQGPSNRGTRSSRQSPEDTSSQPSPSSQLGLPELHDALTSLDFRFMQMHNMKQTLRYDNTLHGYICKPSISNFNRLQLKNHGEPLLRLRLFERLFLALEEIIADTRWLELRCISETWRLDIK